MITLIIIAITCGVSFLTMENHDLKNKYMFNAYAIAHHREWWRFFTHGLLHGNFPHLLLNMLSLYSLGRIVEVAFCDDNLFGPLFGEITYAMLYISALFFSSIFSFFKHKDDRYYNALGASGAVSAVIYALILINPLIPLGVMFIPISIPGWILGIFFLVASWFMAKRNVGNIGHDAHFWGAAYGFLLPILLKPILFTAFIWQLKAFFLYGGIPQ